MTTLGAPYAGDAHVAALVDSRPLQSQGLAHIYSGTGVPGSSLPTSGGKLGDLYLRTDGAPGSTVYVCYASGTPPTWTAIA